MSELIIPDVTTAPIDSWLPLVGGLVGVIGGVIGSILGLLGYRRSSRVETRTFHEPYFRNIWKQVSPSIHEDMKRASPWIAKIRRLLNTAYEEIDESLPANEMSMMGPATKTDHVAWDYDTRLGKDVRRLIGATEDLWKLLSEFQTLVFLITRSATDWIFRQHMAAGLDISDSDHMQRFKEELKGVLEKYIGPVESLDLGMSIDELRDRLTRNIRYRVNLWILKVRLRHRLRRVERTLNRLEPKVLFYDARFTDQAESQ